jgi:hypothetical protein
MIGNYTYLDRTVKSKATKYLLPILFPPVYKEFLRNDDGIINAFYKDVEHPDRETIEILYRFDRVKDMNLYNKLIAGEGYKYSKDFIYNQQPYKVAVYDIPKRYRVDVEKVIRGEYVRTTTCFKVVVSSFWKYDPRITKELEGPIYSPDAYNICSSNRESNFDLIDMLPESEQYYPMAA